MENEKDTLITCTSGKLTQKGQITVPIEVRRKLGLEEGDRIQFEIRDGEIYISAVKSLSIMDVVGSLSERKNSEGEEVG